MRRTILLLVVMAAMLPLASGVALAVTKVGNNGPNTLNGTNNGDNLIGKGGNDRLFALRGRDNLLGGPGRDVVFGGNDSLRIKGGDKNLFGGPGNDYVNGGKGSDDVVGGNGNDLLGDGQLRESSRDKLFGEKGNDVILADNKPAFRDLIACGPGFDRVLVDVADVVAPNCERVVVVRGSLDNIIRQEQRFFRSIPQSFFAELPRISGR